MKRKIFKILFVGLLVLYAGCAICVPFKLYDWDTYFKIIAIIGGLVSVLGLGATAFVSVDLLSYDSEALQRIADASKEIESKKDEIKDASDKIASLQIKKDELETLVEKASLSLYYKEELDRLYERLLDLIHNNVELNNVILEIPQTEDKLTKLDGEIKQNNEIREVLQTIQKARSKEHPRHLITLRTMLGSISMKL